MLILASKSPRRIELLKMIGIEFIPHPSEFEELNHNISPEELVIENACGKAGDIARKYPDSLILGVDTIGSFKHHILEKPKDYDDAFRMIKLLSGTTHSVYSGICLIDPAHGKELTAIEETKVTFTKMDDSEIQAYLNTGEYVDKAAAFAIQGKGSLFIEKIEGCYFNVMGLPLFRLGRMLKEFGVKIL